MASNPREAPLGATPLPGTEPPKTSALVGADDPATDGQVRDGVEDQRRVIKDGTISVQARVEERQATEVPAMRYVLGIGVILAIIGMFLAWIFLR